MVTNEKITTTSIQLLSLSSKIISHILEARDPYTSNHSIFVANHSKNLGKELGFNELDSLWYGGLLHDIGKIAIPETTLQKPTALSHGEQDMMKRHTIYGVQLLQELEIPEVVKNCILYHHEAYDGSGYPEGLRGNEIPLEARIVSVIDVFHALISDRPYRLGYPPEKALETMKRESHRYDPNVLKIFISKCYPEILKKYK